MKTLILSNSPLLAYVDDEDYEACLSRIWRWTEDAVVSGSVKGGNLCTLHDFILDLHGLGYDRVDHQDRNFCNNQKQNIRHATYSQNNMNRGIPRSNTSGYKGVRFRGKGPNPWTMQIKANKQTYCSNHRTRFLAAWAYNGMALKLHTEFAVLNDLTQDPDFIGPVLPK